MSERDHLPNMSVPYFGTLLGFICAIALILFKQRKWISCVIKTLPRDIRCISRFAKVTIHLYYIKILNLNVGQVFDKVAKKRPNHVAFYFEDKKWTFQKVMELSNQVGNYFLKQGFKKGDVVALFMQNCPEHICIWLGLSKIGVVVPLINSNLKLGSLHHSILIAKSKAIIFQDELSSAIKDAHELGLPEVRLFSWGENSPVSGLESENLQNAIKTESKDSPKTKYNINFNDDLLYVYTSGTTGFPKPTIFKHQRIFMAAISLHYFNCIQDSDIVYTCLPMYHTVALAAVCQAIIHGNSVVIRKKFSASAYWDDCKKYGVTVAQYIGELCRYLLAQPPKPTDTAHKVRIMVGNGLRPEIWSTFVNRFKIQNITEFYGGTDSNCNFVNFDNTVGAVGFIPIWCPSWYPPMKLIKLDEETGEPIRNPKTGKYAECKPLEAGELVSAIIKNNAIHEFPGYANTEASATEKKILKDVFWRGDKAFRSGDYLVRDELGYFYFKDRSGDTFRYKGENCSTAEIESVLANICNLNDVAVYGVSVPFTDGKAGMAAIADPNGSLDIEGLSAKISAALPIYAIPVFLRIVKFIDTTGTLKIQKVQLQKKGFNIHNTEDPIFIYYNKLYVPLDQEKYDSLMKGTLKI